MFILLIAFIRCNKALNATFIPQINVTIVISVQVSVLELLPWPCPDQILRSSKFPLRTYACAEEKEYKNENSLTQKSL